MHRDAPSIIAWVESPLQLVGAAEWAAAHGQRVPIAGRLTDQMSETADELVARKAMFGRLEPYIGIPWRLLAENRHWLVGDAFSGQFRLAAAVLRPRRVTLLDDGANSLAFADTLLGRRDYVRPGVHERGATTLAAPFALELLLDRARVGALEMFTAFQLGLNRREALQERGVRLESHRFEWTRKSATRGTREDVTPSGRVLLGSARPVDGRLDLAVYLAWVAAEASIAPLTYLPHRREPVTQLDAVRAIPGVRISDLRLPAELVLAGASRPLEVLTLASSTTTTLPLVLEGTGSVIREWAPGEGCRERVLR
ncbi:hypothetical protein ACPW96_15225 [Micromonospora sp. DT81.3]|uniref:hypothetical protein n=1 Tax=Micromonospora sp. DT81.3 TaxID=3416523 RepID=UPI003CEE2E27